jgi:tRNA G10  N-methylase Trm11
MGLPGAQRSKMRLTPIHPFPARMAPEIVLESLAALPRGSTVLDPMSGSGTVLRASVEAGLDAVGFDSDPLAVLMARVWTRKLPFGLATEAEALVRELRGVTVDMPEWHSACAETRAFAQFWFEAPQYRQLSALAMRLATRQDEFADALRLALSRVVITKEKGASIARDTSHSRPHRVFFNNDFDVFRNFIIAARRIEERLKPEAINGSAQVQEGDARAMSLADASVDAVITSPPYLNAIDYMRGHRLALIWLGFKVGQLRSVRSNAIGAEAAGPGCASSIEHQLPEFSKLEPRGRAIVRRYACDIEALMREIRRVIRPGGNVLVVVGNSTIKDVNVSNADINLLSAEHVGLKFGTRVERDLPTRSRYLPITGEASALLKRMRTETILTFHG